MTGEGILADPKKVEAILNFPVPPRCEDTLIVCRASLLLQEVYPLLLQDCHSAVHLGYSL